MNTSISSLLKHKGFAVYSVPPQVTVSEAVREMNRHKVGSVMVMDAGRLIGIFTERDVLTRVVAAEVDPKSRTVGDVMTKNPITIDMDATLQGVMDLFAQVRCRHLPVLKDDQVCGMVSIGDVSRWLADAHRDEAEQLRQYITGGYSSPPPSGPSNG
jgi:CBS domain-containing protein